MKHFFIGIMLLCTMPIIGQTVTENYVRTTAYRQGVDQGEEDNLESSKKIDAITYFDGLGRTTQSIAVRAGGTRQNIVTHVEYDALGRSPIQYLPYATTGEITNPLNFTNSAALKISIGNFYDRSRYGNTLNPFTEMIYEDSPLNRVYEQAAPGNSWALGEEHTLKFDYKTNLTDEVYYFKVNFPGGNTKNPVLALEEHYPSGQLYKNTTKDENWNPASGNDHTTVEFRDKKGQVVLKRNYNANLPHDTYYVYDDFGNLSFVLSPEASERIIVNNVLTSNYMEVLDQLGYRYRYDHRNRLIEKKLPGKGWEHIVYDRLDRPILTQDAKQRAISPREWYFTKYDAFGRIAYTGIKKANISRNTFQTIADSHELGALNESMSSNAMNIAGTMIYYSNTALPSYLDPSKGDHILMVNYYDSYTDMGTYELPPTVYGEQVAANAKGLSTVSKIRVLETDHWITTVSAYDEKARPILTYNSNPFLDTEDTTEFLLDFNGNILELISIHQKEGHQAITTKDYFSYDHQNRPLKHLQKVGEGPVQRIAVNGYDELGKLRSKKVGEHFWIWGIPIW